jgi:hypothetical protein
MNLFIVVIPMLLTIIVMTQMAMIEISLPTQAGAGEGQEEGNEAEIEAKLLVISPEGFELFTPGGEDDAIKLPILNPDATDAIQMFDFYRLDQEIAKLREDQEALEAIGIMPDPRVTFETLLLTIDVAKTNGFEVDYKKFERTGLRRVQ